MFTRPSVVRGGVFRSVFYGRVVAGSELEPTSAHPAGGSARPNLVLIRGGRDTAAPGDSEQRPRGRIRRFASDLWESMIIFNGDYHSPHSWID